MIVASVGTVVGIVVGVLIVLLIVFFIGGYIATSRRREAQDAQLRARLEAADAALAEATKRGWPVMCIAVVSPSGDLVYFVKMDDCQYGSIAIAQHKARAAATFRRPTLVFERLLGRGQFFSYLATLDGVIASRGGNPIVVNGKIIGAIGVSGGTGTQDEVVSLAGAATAK